jgi:hypothetical protein
MDDTTTVSRGIVMEADREDADDLDGTEFDRVGSYFSKRWLSNELVELPLSSCPELWVKLQNQAPHGVCN